MNTLNRFRIVKLTTEVQKEFDAPELVCADPDSMPFLEGETFYYWLTEYNGCESTTAYSYLSIILPFLTYLWECSPSLRYTVPAEHIRNRVREYLKEKLGCVVRPHRGGNLIVKQPKTITARSARLFLTALRRFYFYAKLKGWYTDINPMEWSSRLMQGHEFKPQMPPRSGLTLPADKKGRVPDTYFCIVADDWQPHIIDDPALRQRLLPFFFQKRDYVIARILFDSGARISEVLGLTFGDWRKKGQGTKAWTKNKGSYGERVKEIWWSDDTAQLLRNYIRQERRHCDPTGRDLNDLPDSALLFITDEGDPYSYIAFYFNWQKACQKAKVKVTPHQIRHWFVTMALHVIDKEASGENERQALRQSLIEYMSWRSPQTIEAYDHHLRRIDFAPTHAALARLSGKEEATSASVHPKADTSTGIMGVSEVLKRLLTKAMMESKQDEQESL